MYNQLKWKDKLEFVEAMADMQISQFFLNGDMQGAITYMRNHEEFKEILPAYVAIFEDCQYRTFEVPDIRILAAMACYMPNGIMSCWLRCLITEISIFSAILM